MTCRLEVMYDHKDPAPRTCPSCGLSGICSKGYKLEKVPNSRPGAYAIVDPLGIAKEFDVDGFGRPLRTGPAKVMPEHVPKSLEHIGEGNEKPARVIATRKRLGLIGYLTTLTKLDGKSVQELDKIVDDIADILLD